MFVFQSFHVVIPGCDLAVIYLFLSLSLEHEEAFENFQESGTKKMYIWMILMHYLPEFELFQQISEIFSCSLKQLKFWWIVHQIHSFIFKIVIKPCAERNPKI